MRKILILIPVLVCFLVIACGDDNNTDNDAGVINEKTRAVVLCDASNSTTLKKEDQEQQAKGRLEQLQQYAALIPKWYPFESQIYYYPVTDIDVSTELVPMISYDIKMESDRDTEIERVGLLMGKLKQAVDSAAKATKNSCITLSIKRCFTRLNELRDASPGFKEELVIISDMLEDCGSDSGEIGMHVYDPAKLTAAIGQLDRQSMASNKAPEGLKVRLIINSPGMNKQFEKVRDAWKRWFSRAGITEENLKVYTGKPNIDEHPLFEEE